MVNGTPTDTMFVNRTIESYSNGAVTRNGIGWITSNHQDFGTQLMNFRLLIESMERFQNVLPALLSDLSEDSIRWKPRNGNWSILEIVCHLADEEVEDFRTRVRMTLENPMDEWPAIDPEGIAISRNYQDAEIGNVLDRFVRERSNSIIWLRDLKNPDWNLAYQHPRFGSIQAGEVLAAWAAHDHLHTRQITKRLFEISSRDAEPYGVQYAGEWSA